MSRRNRYPEKKGRSGGSRRFVLIDHRLLSSPAYRALSPNGRTLLIELAMLEDGSNNGGLFLSVRDAAARMGVVDLKAATRAFDELQGLGFIAMTADAHFAVKAGEGSRARTWRLTWQAVGGKQGPTHEYEQLEPEPQTAGRQRMERGLRALKRFRKEQSERKNAVEESTTRSGKRVEESTTTPPPFLIENPGSVEENTTRFPKSGGSARFVVVEDSTTHSELPSAQRDSAPVSVDHQPPSPPAKIIAIKHQPVATGDAPSAEQVRDGLRAFKRSMPVGSLGRLAARAEISLSSVSLLLNLGKPPSPAALARIAAALAELSGPDGEKQPDRRTELMDPNVRHIFEMAEARR